MGSSLSRAYEDIKRYLTKPLVLVAPTSGKPFLLYVKATDHSLDALLAQKDDNGHERAIYYPSRTLIGTKLAITLLRRNA